MINAALWTLSGATEQDLSFDPHEICAFIRHRITSTMPCGTTMLPAGPEVPCLQLIFKNGREFLIADPQGMIGALLDRLHPVEVPPVQVSFTEPQIEPAQAIVDKAIAHERAAAWYGSTRL